MRTQKLLVAVAALAVSLATSMAQVYSQNIVGYVNVTVPSGYSLLANPLSAGSTNGANEIMPQVDGSIFLTWNGAGYDYRSYDSGFGGWIDGNFNPANPPALPPGKGFFYFNPGSATNVTFTGSVIPAPGTTNSLNLTPGYTVNGSVLPTSGLASSVGLPIVDGMIVLQWNGAGFNYRSYDSGFGGWIDGNFNSASEPTINIGQGFFYFNPGSTVQWKQTLP